MGSYDDAKEVEKVGGPWDYWADLDAADAGRAGRRQNQTLFDNPHPPGCRERGKWFEGWCNENIEMILAGEATTAPTHEEWRRANIPSGWESI